MRTHSFRPELVGATHMFLQISWRDTATSPDAGAELAAVFHQMADRDTAVFETVQRCLDENVVLRRYTNGRANRAAVCARRVLQSLVEDERGR